MTEKYVLENGVIKDTTNNITFHDFGDILILINGQSRHLTELSEENEQLKKENQELQEEVNKRYKVIKARGMTIMNLKSRINELERKND